MQNKTKKKLLTMSLSIIITGCLTTTRNTAFRIITHKECAYHKTTILPQFGENLDDVFPPGVCNPPEGGDILSR